MVVSWAILRAWMLLLPLRRGRKYLASRLGVVVLLLCICERKVKDGKGWDKLLETEGLMPPS